MLLTLAQHWGSTVYRVRQVLPRLLSGPGRLFFDASPLYILRAAIIVFLLLASCLSSLPQKVLTNDDIVKMVKGGLSDDVILLAIESQPSNFDVSPLALIELKQQGASKAVLNKILDVAAARQRAAASVKTVSIIPAGPEESREDMLYFPVAFSADQVSFDGPGGTPQLDGKIYVGFGLLRFERPAGAGTEVSLVNPRTRIGYVLGPGQDTKVYDRFVDVRGYQGKVGLSRYFLPVDPTKPCRNYKSIIDCRAISQEFVNNRPTTKWELTHALGAQSWVSYEWIDAKLWIALRRQYLDHVTELRNIREESQPASLFEVPASALK
jgi:hypothetical protein